jgi:N-acetylglucosaminyldiphosphoundecaprenol N-acetyl-beta-D-mannosaminyltransferase
MRTRVFCLKFSGKTYRDIAADVCRRIDPGSGLRLLVTTNVDHVVLLQRNRRFRDAYEKAWMITIDGAPIYLYAKMRGVEVPGRVTGADLFPKIIESLSPLEHRLFFVVSNAEVAEILRQRMKKKGYADEAIRLEVPPYGFERMGKYCDWLARTIGQFKATHLFFGVGAPKSEIWINEHRQELGDLYAFGFGAALEFYAGTAKRAPAFMRKLGLEWLWRFGGDPHRLFRRYFLDSWCFLYAVYRDVLTGGCNKK